MNFEFFKPDYLQLGGNHLCSIGRNTLWCIGHNDFGQTTVPTLLRRNPHSISLGPSNTCAISSEKALLCWGSNHFGQSVSFAINEISTTESIPNPHPDNHL
mmetsp:Transcript_6457/g.5650  ORF Transcript_6457/g.5650 Transcript_6457/m.5650 type:complete len:101 (-) Transcript_6457:803-1105(-)